MDDIPFHHVYIHALIRDAEGQKMSKTKGNVIDPLAMMDQYGTDALRFTLAAFAAQGRDIKLDEDRIDGYRNFCNKLWNASRFAFMNLEDYKGTCTLEASKHRSLADRWILSRLNRTAQDVQVALEAFRFNDAATTLYKFIWNEFCDWYIELSKSRLNSDNADEKHATQNVLIHVLEATLKLLHPFMPFITEEIWQKLPKDGDSIMVAPFPEFDPKREDTEAETHLQWVMEIINAARNIRGEMNLKPSLKIPLRIKTNDSGKELIANTSAHYVKELARLEDLEVGPSVVKPKVSASSILSGAEVIVPLGRLDGFRGGKKACRKRVEKS